MSLYTLVIDYRGGTYISQARSKTLVAAPKLCIENLDISNLKKEINEKDKENIISQLLDEKFVKLDGKTNIWCGSVLIHGKLVLMNLIKTECI